MPDFDDNAQDGLGWFDFPAQNQPAANLPVEPADNHLDDYGRPGLAQAELVRVELPVYVSVADGDIDPEIAVAAVELILEAPAMDGFELVGDLIVLGSEATGLVAADCPSGPPTGVEILNQTFPVNGVEVTGRIVSRNVDPETGEVVDGEITSVDDAVNEALDRIAGLYAEAGEIMPVVLSFEMHFTLLDGEFTAATEDVLRNALVTPAMASLASLGRCEAGEYRIDGSTMVVPVNVLEAGNRSLEALLVAGFAATHPVPGVGRVSGIVVPVTAG